MSQNLIILDPVNEMQDIYSQDRGIQRFCRWFFAIQMIVQSFRLIWKQDFDDKHASLQRNWKCHLTRKKFCKTDFSGFLRLGMLNLHNITVACDALKKHISGWFVIEDLNLDQCIWTFLQSRQRVLGTDHCGYGISIRISIPSLITVHNKINSCLQWASTVKTLVTIFRYDSNMASK